MGGSVNFPANREGSSTTGAVAELLNAFTFPTIIPLATDIAALDDLPDLPAPEPIPSDSVRVVPESRLTGVRALQDSTATALAAMHRHKNQGAALTAVLVERMLSAAEAEATVLELDPWQRETSRAGVRAEIAALFNITEGYAGALMIDAATLVRHLPATMAQLSAGVLGWEHAVIIADETSLLRAAHLPQDTIDTFEQVLLGKAEHATLHSFREKARRARERTYPETLVPKTRQAYERRQLGISRSRDGMAWLNLYGPSPTIEAIWTQCTATAQAAQGPHENRTLTQLRADIAAALLLCQSLEANNIHAPAPAPTGDSTLVAEKAQGTAPDSSGGSADTPQQGTWFTTLADTGPDPCQGAAFPDPDRLGPHFYPWELPVFDDPNYQDPAFREPDPRNQPDWQVPGQPPHLTPTSSNPANTSGTGGNGAAGPESSQNGTGVSGCGAGVWPPLPQVTPILLVPALSLLGFTDEPAWMSGAGPISIEVAKHLTANAPSFYRVLVDPISNQPLDAAPDIRRLTKAMEIRLLMRDEYCVFPGCNARAVNCETDHLHAFSTGGPTTYDNLESLCRLHHRLKHHKDDRTRNGHVRTDQSFERQSVHPRAWSPRKTPQGIEWTSPTGHQHPPEQQDTQPPVYNETLKTLIDATLKAIQQRQESWNNEDGANDLTAPPWEYRPDEKVGGPEAHPDWIDEDDMDPQDPRWESYTWDPDNLPEPPAQSREETEILDRMSIEDYLRRHPNAALGRAGDA
ncbi:HNH endonuclease signature motif containing protein [Arthrobacter sp. HY1533]|uniref:HNH endonuclease signature motif containing protein n=1 Tax=Arthrobacter sp. HY1533 TaxID=2970919 RepID=UPI0022B9E6A1|nr:HNH endonuclease signature motif containing protein [Arthrobacter sp. HY1533]